MWRGLDHKMYKEVRGLIAEIDPYHPYWVNEAPRGLLKDRIIHATAADVYGLDIYPVPEGGGHSDLEDKGLTAVGKYTDICREATHFSKPIWMILQSFAWEQCGKPDVPPEKATYPTWEQSRFMMYNAIVHGATGMQYHYLGYANKISDQFWSDLRKVTLEISYLEDVITSDSVNPKTVAFDNPNIAFLQKKTNGTMYYLVTNEATEPVTTTLGLTEKSLTSSSAQTHPRGWRQVTLEIPQGRPRPRARNPIATPLQMGYLRPLQQNPAAKPKTQPPGTSQLICSQMNKIPNSKCHERHSHSTNSKQGTATTMPTISSKTSKSTERQSKESTPGQRILRHREALKVGENTIDAKHSMAAPALCSDPHQIDLRRRNPGICQLGRLADRKRSRPGPRPGHRPLRRTSWAASPASQPTNSIGRIAC